MNKFLFAIILLLSPLVAAAQLNVLSVHEARKEICHITGSQAPGIDSRVFVYYSDGVYYLQAHSTNRYDDVFTFLLGETPDGAAQTLGDLASLIEDNKVGTRIVLDRWNGETCLCVIANSFGTTDNAPNGNALKGARILLSASGYAGNIDMPKKSLRALEKGVLQYIAKQK